MAAMSNGRKADDADYGKLYKAIDEFNHQLRFGGKDIDLTHVRQCLNKLGEGERLEQTGDYWKKHIFLPIEEQYDNFLKYNNWLKEKYPNHAMSDIDMKVFNGNILGAANKSTDPYLLFYSHNGDQVLTTRLALEYFSTAHSVVWAGFSTNVKNLMEIFEKNCIRVPKYERVIEGARGFDFEKVHPTDFLGLGRRYVNVPIFEVCRFLDKQTFSCDLGMGAEVFQFCCITHPHYLWMIDGWNIPKIIVPGLEIDTSGKGTFRKKSYFIVNGIEKLPDDKGEALSLEYVYDNAMGYRDRGAATLSRYQ